MPVNNIDKVTLEIGVVENGGAVSVSAEYTARSDGSIQVESSSLDVSPPKIPIRASKTKVTKTVAVTLKEGVMRGKLRRLAFKLGSSTKYKFVRVD